MFAARQTPYGIGRDADFTTSYTRPAMSKVCHVCKKAPAFGNSRSHSMVATRRRFDPNLQRVRIDDGGTPRRVYVCTRCLKAGKVVKAR
jgi:large subunit ribosomal protein L28